MIKALSITLNIWCVSNVSILRSDFPSKMKLAKVRSTYRADNQQLLQDYRLVSV